MSFCFDLQGRHIGVFQCKRSLTYNGAMCDFFFFDLTMARKPEALGRNHNWNLEFGFFSPRLATCGTLFSCDAGQQEQATHPVSHMITRANNQYTDNHLDLYNHFAFHFQYSIQYITRVVNTLL